MKLGVCVPYRNRETHLRKFVPKISRYLNRNNIDFHIYVAHQVDDKLFNRGAMKNIAAKHAFDDGCDYIVWHDVDMIPVKEADYSFPEEGPRHIATRISQMDYNLKYYEYFGGAVVFSKEHVEKTNGYSNGYWDWGMEDDDLYWRCILEELVDVKKLDYNGEAKQFIRLSGDNSYARIPHTDALKNFTHKSHTISVLVRPFMQPHKAPIFLIGDKNKKYLEFPILRIPEYDYGFSFNNSRALSLMYWTGKEDFNYMWAKRYDRYWTWLTATFDYDNKVSRLYVNGEEIDSANGTGSESPMKWDGIIKNNGDRDWYIGTTTTLKNSDPNKWFSGDIAAIYAWGRDLGEGEIARLHKEIPQDDKIIDINFSDDIKYPITVENVEMLQDNIEIYNSVLPYRKDGWFKCLPHPDEGIVDGEFVKGETTAKNEERYVMKMQRGKINHKKDGIEQLVYMVESVDQISHKATMINVSL
jgi:hypothetical protein